MARIDLDRNFYRIDELVTEINRLVPSEAFQVIQFRADLAGLLVVAMAATYETCVKEILFEYSNRKHIDFGIFTSRNYDKLNSRISVKDLKRYCDVFGPEIGFHFKELLKLRKERFLNRTGKNIETSYEQILTWRHDFAHAGIRQTTIEEAAITHRIGKMILYIFDDAFNRP